MYSKQTVLCSIAINKINFNVCFEKRQWNAIPFNFVFFFVLLLNVQEAYRNQRKNEMSKKDGTLNKIDLNCPQSLFLLLNHFFLLFSIHTFYDKISALKKIHFTAKETELLP